MFLRKRALMVAMLLVLCAPLAANAADEPGRNELSLGFGGAFGHVSPYSGGLIGLHYARALSDSLWLVLRPEFVMNLNPPDGTVAKQATFGLDAGLRWHLGPLDTVHFALGAALGARGYLEPGYGACLRVDAHLYVPVSGYLDVIISGALEGGPARMGDESPRTVLQGRGDLWMAMSFRF